MHSKPEKHLHEKRKHPRLKCAGLADLYFIPEILPCRAMVENLSLEGGRFILEQSRLVECNVQVEVAFTVNQLPLRLAGEVRAVHHQTRIGILFPPPNHRVQALLEQLIHELYEQKLASAARKQSTRSRSPTINDP